MVTETCTMLGKGHQCDFYQTMPTVIYAYLNHPQPAFIYFLNIWKLLILYINFISYLFLFGFGFSPRCPWVFQITIMLSAYRDSIDFQHLKFPYCLIMLVNAFNRMWNNGKESGHPLLVFILARMQTACPH